MALFSRIFSRKIPKQKEDTNTSIESPINELKPFLFTLHKNEVRVVLFRECDWRGRKLLFDSTLVEKVPLQPNNSLASSTSNSSDMIVEVSKGFGYKYKKPHADTTNLGETMFGSIAMASRGPSIKMHEMKDPARIMFTKVIQAPRSRIRKRQISDEKTLEDSHGSSMSSVCESHKSGSFSSKTGSFEAMLDDSGFSGRRDSLPFQNSDWLSPFSCSCSSRCPLHRPSLSSNPDNNHVNSSSSLQSGSSLSSLRRRWARSVATSLNFTDNCQSSYSTGKRTKLGVAIIIPLTASHPQEMEQFFHERMTLMNNILTRLQHSTEQAYCRRDVFVQSMVQASNLASQSVTELVGGPRLNTPLWLTLVTDQTDTPTKTGLAQSLISDLSHLLDTLDTKHTNFFISTLLTAVLTHHLGWVPSVFTPDNALADFSRNHPYNPLWAQLSDLQGSLGYPPKISKTIVVGKSEALVQKLITILSYFIRCGEVTVIEPEREVIPDEESHLEYLLENGQDKSLFDKDAIKEFSNASFFEDTGSNSTSTLTKTSTVINMKTFIVKDCDIDNANSLESGFESSNDCESYDDRKQLAKELKEFCKSPKLGKSKSYAHLKETSFSDNTITNFNIGNDGHLIDLTNNNLSVVKVLESNHTKTYKIENERQLSSSQLFTGTVHNGSNPILSEEKSKYFSKGNLFQSSLSETEEKNKVVFVLGEDEELVNIKTQDKSHMPEKCLESPVIEGSHVPISKPPVILIEDVKDSYIYRDKSETAEKTDFTTGNVNDRVVIVQSTQIELDGIVNQTLLKTCQLHRCLSVPEEAVSETDWVKKKRNKEVVQLIKRWLSDSVIQRTCREPESKLNTRDDSKLSAVPDCVFRTSNRPLKDTCERLGRSVELLVNKSDCDVPKVTVENTEERLAFPDQTDQPFTELPPQRSTERRGAERVAGVAGSLFGQVSEAYCPELTLQGVTCLPDEWTAELRESLITEADNSESEAVCVVANTDTWEVVVLSSQRALCAVDDGGVRVGMSQLVANILETTLHLYNFTRSAHMCLSHIETKLLELCLRSQALAELLLNSDFLDMATLTSELDLDANDVPLLLSVASTHSPLVTRKCGLSFQ